MKKAVVTGGAGFIGSHLLEELCQRDYQLTVIDDLSTGKLENLKSVINKTNLKFIEGSITDLPLLQRLFKDNDYVFHLAALASVPRSIAFPRLAHETNVTGTLNVLLAARDNGIKRVVNASSCAIYGDAPGQPKKEDMPKNPLSPYAAAKLAAEEYCEVFQKVYNLPTISLRFFNIYGPRQNPDSDYAAAIPRFIKNAAAGNPVTIFGDGKATRDYTYVKDAVNCYILAAESDATGIYNIGSGKAVTVNDLVKLINRMVGNTTTPIHGSPRPGDILHSRADTKKAKTLGYRPRYTLEEGLTKMIKYMTHHEE